MSEIVGPLQAAAKGADVQQEPMQQQEDIMSGYDPTKSQKALEQQRASVNARRQELLNLTESRKNMMFNPELLAIAQGMFAPTKTGGFGESLGNAAGNLQQVQAQEAKRQEDLVKMRLDLEQGALQQQKEEITEPGSTAEVQGVPCSARFSAFLRMPFCFVHRACLIRRCRAHLRHSVACDP